MSDPETKTITDESDLEVSDLFDISPHSYFVITEVNSDTVTGYVRDGIYNVGDSHEEIFTKPEIISKLETADWDYLGPYSYEGKDINGNPIS